jgi:DNA replication protein DnaC
MSADRDRPMSLEETSAAAQAALEHMRRVGRGGSNGRDLPPAICACGASVLFAGLACRQCEDRERRKQEHAAAAAETSAGLPARYRWCSFDAPELRFRVKDQRAFDRVKAAADDMTIDRLVLIGPTGVGKTILSSAFLVRRCHRLARVGHFTTSYTLSAARAYARLGETPADIVAAIEAECLVLDDLGAEGIAPNSAIPEVLHERHSRLQCTVVTCGFTVEQVRGRYGDGLRRRLIENAEVVEMRPKGAK